MQYYTPNNEKRIKTNNYQTEKIPKYNKIENLIERKGNINKLGYNANENKSSNEQSKNSLF